MSAVYTTTPSSVQIALTRVGPTVMVTGSTRVLPPEPIALDVKCVPAPAWMDLWLTDPFGVAHKLGYAWSADTVASVLVDTVSIPSGHCDLVVVASDDAGNVTTTHVDLDVFRFKAPDVAVSFEPAYAIEIRFVHAAELAWS